MKTGKSTNKELVAELIARNTDGRYATLISNAQHNHYHDFKNPEHIACGKVQFIIDSGPFTELEDLRDQIKNGEYDESMDEEDIASIRHDLIIDGAPDAMFSSLGLKVPSAAERMFAKVKDKHSPN